jgi:multicomponent Na+:H+ antiporter subunit F
MYLAIAVAILIVMTMALIRALLGPTLYDRILAVNMFGTKTVLLLCILSMIAGRGDMVDIAFIYALINFVSMVALLKFNEQSTVSGEQQN